MKRLYFLSFLCACVLGSTTVIYSCGGGEPSGLSSTSDVIFEWDANTEPDLAGYRLYSSDTSGVYILGAGNEVADIPAGTETVTIGNVPNGTWFWVLTAYNTDGLESEPSNEVKLSQYIAFRR